MTDKERSNYVRRGYLECDVDITTVRKGTGCDVGEQYWFEYVHDTDGDPNAESFYRKLSDNNYGDEVYITDEELIENFTIAENLCFVEDEDD